MEILHALMIGIAISILGSFFAWLVYDNFSGALWAEGMASVKKQGLLLTFASGLQMMLLAFFWGGVLFLAILAVSLVQFVVIALPLAHMMTAGVEADAKRSVFFYIVMGALIGAGPWFAFLYFNSDSVWDLGSSILFIGPGLAVGSISGVVLKYRLKKLVANAAECSEHFNLE